MLNAIVHSKLLSWACVLALQLLLTRLKLLVGVLLNSTLCN